MEIERKGGRREKRERRKRRKERKREMKGGGGLENKTNVPGLPRKIFLNCVFQYPVPLVCHRTRATGICFSLYSLR